MGQRSSITSDPDFRWIVFVVCILLFSTFYVNFKSGGIVNGIMAVFNGIYGLGYIFVWFIFLVAVVVYTLYKRKILIEIGIRFVKWIWSFIYHPRR